MNTYTNCNCCNCGSHLDIDTVLKTTEKQKQLRKALREIDFDCVQQHFDDDGDEI